MKVQHMINTKIEIIMLLTVARIASHGETTHLCNCYNWHKNNNKGNLLNQMTFLKVIFTKEKVHFSYR